MKNLLLLFLTFSLFQVNAQDAILYQFQNSTINLSPTLSGTSCNSRLATNYQSQWRSVLGKNAFQTAAISFDKSFNLKNGDKVGAGIRYFFDQAGSVQLRNQQVAISVSYTHLTLPTTPYV